jgi:hypothetical protein
MPIRTYAIVMLAIAAIGCEGFRCNSNLAFSGGPRREMIEEDASCRVEPSCSANSMELGQRHTCIRNSDASLVCFGDNREGQILLGERTSEPVSPRRVDQRAHDVALGDVHTCATYNDAIMCWGRPELVGEGPQPMVWLDSFLSDAFVGALHSCWFNQGSIECMGVWDGVDPAHRSAIPVRVDAIDESVTGDEVLRYGASMVSAGTQSCAIFANSLWCWGGIAPDGLFGPGEWARTPHRISDDLDSGTPGHYFTNIALSPLHGCVVRLGGLGPGMFGVWCWGENDSGQLGTGNYEASNAPVSVVWDSPESPGAIIALATGAEMSIEWTDTGPVLAYGAAHSCAVVGDYHIDGMERGTVYCWGNNDKGQLGDGTQTSSPTPVRVVGLPEKISRIVAGGAHTCALDVEGGVWCWGDNTFGQLGVPPETAAFRTRPERVEY